MGYFKDAGQVVACEQQTYFRSLLPGRSSYWLFEMWYLPEGDN